MKTLILVYPGCIFYEVGSAISLLSETNPVVIAGPEKGTIEDASGFHLQVDLSYKDVQVEDYKYILVTGGDFHSIRDNTQVDQILQRASQFSEKVVGGICNGAVVLGKSGILKDREYTTTANRSWASEEEFGELLALADQVFEGAHFVDKNVVISENIVTAKPWAHIDFALELAVKGGDVSTEQKQKLRDYYTGNYPKIEA